MLEHHELRHSPFSVASLAAPPEPMSGTRNRPMLVKESPAPHYHMVEDSPAPQCIVVEESPVPMSGVKYRPCLVMESPELTEERAGATSPVPMSGTKDRPSLVDDFPAVPKVKNLCCGGENPVGEVSATPNKFGLSSLNYVSYGGPPTAGAAQLGGGGPEVATGPEPVFASHPQAPSSTVVHKSPQYIVVEESPLPPLQLKPVRRISSPPSPSPGAYNEYLNGIPYLIRPSHGGGSGGEHSSSGGAPAPVAARRTPSFCPAGGPSGPSVAGGAAGRGVGGSSPPRGGGSPSFRHSRGPAQTRGEAEWKHTCDGPRCMVHYETCIQSLVAQVQDLRAQSPGLQQSQQELSQAVASTLRAHLDQVPLNYPSETVVQPSSTAHFHYGFPTTEPLSWYSNKLLSSNLKTAIFQPCKRCQTP